MNHIRLQHNEILTEQKRQRLEGRPAGRRRTYRVQAGRPEKSVFNRKAVQKFFDISLLAEGAASSGGGGGGDTDPALCIGQSLDVLRRSVIRRYVQEYFHEHGTLRFGVTISAWMERQFRDTEADTKLVYFKSYMEVLNSMRDFNRIYNQHSTKIHKEFRDYVMNGSGWTLRNVTGAYTYLSEYKPLLGGANRPIHLQVPAAIRNSGCVVNLDTGNSGECFKYATLCAAFYNDMKANGQRVTVGNIKKHYGDKLNFTGIDYPVGVKNEKAFKQFEANNPDYALNIIMLQTKEIHSTNGRRSVTRGGKTKKSKAFNIHTARMSPFCNDQQRFPLYLLLLYNIDDNRNVLAHYTTVTKLNVFWNHARPTAAYNKSIICWTCQTRFTGRNYQRNYNTHFNYCQQNTAYNRNLSRNSAYKDLGLLDGGGGGGNDDDKSICLNCHTCYVGGSQANREKYLREHTKACTAHPPAFVKMPSNPVLSFDRYKNQRPKPFRIYSVRIQVQQQQ